jgi:hypothetical protein
MDGDGHADLFVKHGNQEACSLWPEAGGGIVLDRDAILSGGIPKEVRAFVESLYGSKDTGLPDFVAGPPGTQEGVLHLENTVAAEVFGSRSEPAGDLDGDGFPDLLIGAPGVLTGGSLTGSAYLLRGGADLKGTASIQLPYAGTHAVRLRPEDPVRAFGAYFSGGFDWNRDGAPDFLVSGRTGPAYLVFGDVLFVRGDSDGNGKLAITDAVVSLQYLFQGGTRPSCPDAADATDDGKLDLTDPIYTLNHLFLGGPALPAPYPERGTDPTADDIECHR